MAIFSDTMLKFVVPISKTMRNAALFKPYNKLGR